MLLFCAVIRRLRQVVKTPPSHGGFKGSNPLGVTIKLKLKRALRAAASFWFKEE